MMFKSLDTHGTQKVEWGEFFEMCKANVSVTSLEMGTDAIS